MSVSAGGRFRRPRSKVARGHARQQQRARTHTSDTGVPRRLARSVCRGTRRGPGTRGAFSHGVWGAHWRASVPMAVCRGTARGTDGGECGGACGGECSAARARRAGPLPYRFLHVRRRVLEARVDGALLLADELALPGCRVPSFLCRRRHGCRELAPWMFAARP